MTHPFHPLAGQEFDLVVRKHNWAEDRVSFFVGDELRSLPAGWTDVDPADPFVVIGAGRSPFRLEDLLSLAALLDGLRAGKPRCRVKQTTP